MSQRLEFLVLVYVNLFLFFSIMTRTKSVLKQSVLNNMSSNMLYLRKLQGHTFEDLARVLTPGKSSIQNYEKGKSEPSISIVAEMAELFGVSIDDMVNRDLKNSPRHTERGLSDLSREELEDKYIHLMDKIAQVRKERTNIIKLLNTI